jgi:hypothetical protein
LLIEDPLYLPTRTFSQRLTNQVAQYNHELRAIGGYWSSQLQINDSQERIENWIEYGLGRHLATYNPYLETIWEGFVNKIVATLGPFQFEIGPLIEIGNQVAVTYSTVDPSTYPPVLGARQTTAAADNTASQDRYGIWQKTYSINGATATEATQLRDSYVSDPKRAYPATSRQSNVSGSAEPSVRVECLGYWAFLKAFYYTSTNLGYVDLDIKLQDILVSSPNAVFSTDYSQVAANGTLVPASADGSRTAEDMFKDLNSRGDASLNTYSMGFYDRRRLWYQPVPTTIEYQQRITGNRGLVNEVNQQIRPWDAQAAKYIFFPDFLVGRFPPTTTVTLGKDPRVGYIEVAKFSAPYGLSLDGKKLGQLDQALARRGMGSSG